MPRPKKRGPGRLVFSFSMSPLSSATVQGRVMQLMEGMDELAKMEGKSRSEIILAAMAEYLTQHHPGNPQVKLFSVTDNLSQESQVSISQAKKALSNIIGMMKREGVDVGYWKERLESNLKKAAKTYDRTKDPSLLKIIESAKSILGL